MVVMITAKGRPLTVLQRASDIQLRLARCTRGGLHAPANAGSLPVRPPTTASSVSFSSSLTPAYRAASASITCIGTDVTLRAWPSAVAAGSSALIAKQMSAGDCGNATFADYSATCVGQNCTSGDGRAKLKSRTAGESSPHLTAVSLNTVSKLLHLCNRRLRRCLRRSALRRFRCWLGFNRDRRCIPSSLPLRSCPLMTRWILAAAGLNVVDIALDRGCRMRALRPG